MLCHSSEFPGTNPVPWLPAATRLRGNCSLRSIPHGGGAIEVGVIRHVAADGGVVAKDGVFHRRLARPHRLKEIPQMVLEFTVPRWILVRCACLEGFRRSHFRIVLPVQFRLVSASHLLRITRDVVARIMVFAVLRRYGQVVSVVGDFDGSS